MEGTPNERDCYANVEDEHRPTKREVEAVKRIRSSGPANGEPHPQEARCHTDSGKMGFKYNRRVQYDEFAQRVRRHRASELRSSPEPPVKAAT